MRSLIQEIIQSELSEYIDKIRELETEIGELKRRTNNMNRVGKVVEWNDNHTRIKVKFGENITPFIKWFSACAGDVAEYRLPSIGEQAVLLNVGGGDNSTTTVALIGLFSDEFPPPTTNPNEILRVYPDGSRVLYDKNLHKLEVKVCGDALVEVTKSATVNVGGKTAVTSVGNATVDAPEILLNGGKGVVTGAHKCMVTGLPHGDCSKVVMAGS